MHGVPSNMHRYAGAPGLGYAFPATSSVIVPAVRCLQRCTLVYMLKKQCCAAHVQNQDL